MYKLLGVSLIICMGNILLMSNKMDLMLYDKVINAIYDEHTEATKQWLEYKKVYDKQNMYNLGKVCICDICNVENGILLPEFKKYIDSYKQNIFVSLGLEILVKIKKTYGVSITGRVKNEDSIINKINEKSKQKLGKFPVNKCLNDLVGFRIIDSEYNNNINNLIAYLNNTKRTIRIRHMSRINGLYKAYHIYFKGENNFYFPAELQIWDKADEHTNLVSHKIYKREYTSWPQKYTKYFEGSE